MLAFFDLEALSRSWLAHCRRAYNGQPICKELEKVFQLKHISVEYGGDGLFLGTLQERQRRCFLAAADKVLDIQQKLQTAWNIQLPAAANAAAASAIVDLEQIVITSIAEFYKATKLLKKHEKALEKVAKLEAARQQRADLIQRVASEQLLVFIAVDVEWYERNDRQILELGWSLWNNRTRTHWSRHWIVSETIHVVNGKYVPNNKHHFLFGSSQTGPLREGVACLQHDLNHGGLDPAAAPPGDAYHAAYRPDPSASGTGATQARTNSSTAIVLVGHGIKVDLSMLQRLGIKLPGWLEVADTQQMFWARSDGEGNPTPGLGKLLEEFRVPTQKLHNAGNDARYTMEAMLCLLDPALPPQAAPNFAMEDEDDDLPVPL